MTSALVGSLSRWDTCLEILRHFCFYPETLRLIVVGWFFTRNGLHKTLQHDKPVDPYWISIPELWNQAIMASSLEDICASSGVDPSLCNELIQEGWTAEAFDLAAPDLGSFDHFGRAFPIH